MFQLTLLASLTSTSYNNSASLAAAYAPHTAASFPVLTDHPDVALTASVNCHLESIINMTVMQFPQQEIQHSYHCKCRIAIGIQQIGGRIDTCLLQFTPLLFHVFAVNVGRSVRCKTGKVLV